jgi:CRP-like cAMP-binding protein/hydrogenase maturation factor
MVPQAPGKIIEEHNEGNSRIGVVEFGGRRRAIYLNLVPEARVGDFVRFHAGFATERVHMVDPAIKEGQPAGMELGWSEEDEDTDSNFETGHAYRLLSALEPRHLSQLIPLAVDKQFEAGQTIFRSGDESLFLQLIVTGDVILEETTGNRPVPIQTLHAGDAMGWSALTAAARTHFQARALSAVSTLAFAGDQLRAVCDRDPALGYAFMKRLMELLTERLDALRMKLAGRWKPEELQ